MSELKAIRSGEIYNIIEYEDCYRTDDLYYPKSEADKVIEEKDKEIAELKEERRWRKFPDEKPKWGEEVIVVDDESRQYIVRFSHDMKWISWGKMNTCESKYVKYWMPLPSAPKEEK